MKRGQSWYKRDPIAALDGYQGLGPELIGAYNVLLDLIYARGGETRRDDRHLAGVMGCSVRKAKSLTDQLLDLGKIQIHDDFITNSRAKREAKKSQDISEARSSAGRKGGQNGAGHSKNRYLTQAKMQANASKEKRRKEKKEDPPIAPPEGGGVGILEKGERLLALIGVNFSDPTWYGDFSLISQWEGDGIDFELDIFPAIQQAIYKSKKADKPRTLKYFDKPVRAWHSRRKPDKGLIDHYIAKKDSSQWRAWREYRLQNGETVRAMDAQDSWVVPTEWPPEDGSGDGAALH